MGHKLLFARRRRDSRLQRPICLHLMVAVRCTPETRHWTVPHVDARMDGMGRWPLGSVATTSSGNRCTSDIAGGSSNGSSGSTRACRGTRKRSFEPVRGKPRNRAAGPEGKAAVSWFDSEVCWDDSCRKPTACGAAIYATTPHVPHRAGQGVQDIKGFGKRQGRKGRVCSGSRTKRSASAVTAATLPNRPLC